MTRLTPSTPKPATIASPSLLPNCISMRPTRLCLPACLTWCSRRTRRNSRKRLASRRKKQMRPGQPPDRIVRGSLSSAFPPLGAAGRRYWSDSTHWECHFYQVLAANSRFEELLFANPCGGQRPNPLKEQEVEEAAMPGQPARARAHFRFPLENRQLPPASP